MLHHPAAPRPVLPVRRDDDPLFTERMPPLFPHHACSLLIHHYVSKDGRARRRAGDDERGVAGAPLVLLRDGLDASARALAAEDGDRAAADAARDLRAV